MNEIRVIIADDHAILRDGLASLIDGQPDMRVVDQAEDGLELQDKCAAAKPDVAVVDISMPKCTGLEAIGRLRDVSPRTRVLVLTMHDNQRYLRRVLASGGAGYLIKRTAGKELITAIREVHAGRSYIRVSLTPDGLSDVVGKPEPGDAPQPSDVLSPRELQVLKLLALGYTNKEAAAKLDLATKSVDTYRVRLQEKLGVKGRANLVRYALEAGLLKEPAAPAPDENT